MIGSFLAAAFLMGSQAPELQVDVGRVDWAALPPLKAVQRAFPTPDMVGKVESMLGAPNCSIPGQTSMRFDINVPYAVQVNPDGTSSHVVVAEIGCPALESYVGLLVLELARRGDFRASGAGHAAWYKSSLNFNLR
ncbi:MAG: hypothetical protein JWO81_3105 [Alphaproteobacteria bacterium]|nr:hypothetical protein [Alphaproteobacteria bacterium]